MRKKLYDNIFQKYCIYSKNHSRNVITNHKYAKTRRICWKYFFKSVLFIVEQFHNAITDPENAKTRRIRIFKNFEDILNRHVRYMRKKTFLTIIFRKYCVYSKAIP